MDAADLTSFTFSSGSNISLWKDKSGFGNNFTTVSGTNTRIADGGYSVVSFPSGAVMSSANQVNLTTSSAIFIISKLTSTAGRYLLAFTNIDDGVGNPTGDFSIRLYQGVLQGIGNTYGNAGDIGNSNYYVNGTFNPSLTSTTFLNTYSLIGTVASLRSGSTYITLSTTIYNSAWYIGNIAEFIFYPGGVSNPDRQQIEGYLAWKWGLQGSLDSSNPYKNSSPSTTNPAGISRPVGLPVRSIACIATPNTRLFTVTFTYLATGDHSQTFQVPAAISPAKLTVYMWGAGGGSGTGSGGAGAFIQGMLTVTPGDTLTIIVGGGGVVNGTGTFGGGGDSGAWDSASGGGRSAIQLSGTELVDVGGGGGAGYQGNSGGAANYSPTINGGAGYTGGGNTYGGYGGTQTAGGAAVAGAPFSYSPWQAALPGSYLQGGAAGSFGGGGGGGFYGGAGGGTSSVNGCGGGGGSSYTTNTAFTLITGSNSPNTGSQAPATSSPYYASGVAASGGNGLIVLTYYS